MRLIEVTTFISSTVSAGIKCTHNIWRSCCHGRILSNKQDRKKKKKKCMCVTQMCYRSPLASLSAEGKEKENQQNAGKAHRSAAAAFMHQLVPDFLSAEVLERERKEGEIAPKKSPIRKKQALDKDQPSSDSSVYIKHPDWENRNLSKKGIFFSPRGGFDWRIIPEETRKRSVKWGERSTPTVRAMRSLMMSLCCFQLDVKGFVVGRKNVRGWGGWDQLGFFVFFHHSRFEFLCSRAAAQHEQRCRGAEKTTLRPVLWSVVKFCAIGSLGLHTHTHTN